MEFQIWIVTVMEFQTVMTIALIIVMYSSLTQMVMELVMSVILTRGVEDVPAFSVNSRADAMKAV